MENVPAITISGTSRYPGADPDIWDRYVKWNEEVYSPLMMRWPARLGIDFYEIYKENPLFPSYLMINHHQNLQTQQKGVDMPEMVSIYEDMANWRKRNVVDRVFAGGYQLVKNFRIGASLGGNGMDTRIENALILHLEAYDLFPEDRDKFSRWFEEYGVNVFIPLFMKRPGIK